MTHRRIQTQTGSGQNDGQGDVPQRCRPLDVDEHPVGDVWDVSQRHSHQQHTWNTAGRNTVDVETILCFNSYAKQDTALPVAFGVCWLPEILRITAGIVEKLTVLIHSFIHSLHLFVSEGHRFTDTDKIVLSSLYNTLQNVNWGYFEGDAVQTFHQ